jgi:hypothetical protein
VEARGHTNTHWKNIQQQEKDHMIQALQFQFRVEPKVVTSRLQACINFKAHIQQCMYNKTSCMNNYKTSTI